MNYLTIDELKKQCIIDLDFTEDDDYLAALGDTAGALVEQQIDSSLSDVVAENDGELPSPLKHAMKLIVEYLYNNRGSDESQIPEAYFYMCKLYRKFT